MASMGMIVSLSVELLPTDDARIEKLQEHFKS
jgi:hypothetical protein